MKTAVTSQSSSKASIKPIDLQRLLENPYTDLVEIIQPPVISLLTKDEDGPLYQSTAGYDQS